MRLDGFRPLTGIVLRAALSGWTGVCFRPLTGIVQRAMEERSMVQGFRPPHGDCTKAVMSFYKPVLAFAPLRGSYQDSGVRHDGRFCFRPLAGIVP